MTTTILLSILVLILCSMMALLIRQIFIQMNTRQAGEREAFILSQQTQQTAYSDILIAQAATSEQMVKSQSEMMTKFSGQLSSLMEMQGQLLKRVLVGEDLLPDQQTTISQPPSEDERMSLEDELLLLPPHIRDQVIREEAELALHQDPMSTVIPRIDPRAAVVDPTRTREEGSVIWSPPT